MKKSFNYFNIESAKSIRSRQGPWYIVIAADSSPLWDFGGSSPGLTLAGCKTMLWFIINAPDENFFVNVTDNCYYFFFENKKIADLFYSWWENKKIDQLNYNGGHGYRSQHIIWPTKKDFDNDLLEHGNIVVKANFKYPLKYYDKWEDDEYFSVTESAVDIFIWCNRYTEGKIWRWDKTFYFEREDDAAAFKLVFAKEENEDD